MANSFGLTITQIPYDAHSLIQYANGATHTRVHTQDVVIRSDVCRIIMGMPSMVDPCLYDTKGNRSGEHVGIYMTLDCTKPQHMKNEITFHRHCAIPLPEYMKDIETSNILRCTSGTTDNLVEAYNCSIKV